MSNSENPTENESQSHRETTSRTAESGDLSHQETNFGESPKPRRGQSDSSQTDAKWFQKSKGLITENLLETKRMLTMGAIDLSQAPTDQPVHADGFQIGDILNERYRLIHVLGYGGSAFVWLANDQILERLVAVKLYRMDFLEDVDLTMLAYEAKIMARFEHPSILPIYDFGQHEERPFLILKFVPQSLERNSKLPERLAAKIVIQIAESIEFLHENGVVHCDIKPGNILISGNGRAYLTDYGIALDKQTFPQFEHTAGTPGFMSPERVQGRSISASSDIFSLGIVLFHYVTGRVPTSHDSKTLNSQLGNTSKRLRQIILKSVATDSKKKYTNIQEVIQSLRDLIAYRPLRLWEKAAITSAFLLCLAAGSYGILENWLYPGPNYPTQTINTSSISLQKIVHGDWDLDGDVDFAAFDQPNHSMELFVNQGNGNFVPSENSLINFQASDLNSGYLLNYDKPALIQSFVFKPAVHKLVLRNGQFIVETESINLSLIEPCEPTTADLNNDKLPDLIVLDRKSPDISVRLALNDKIFLEETILYSSEFEESRTGNLLIQDVNSDKRLDIIVSVQGLDDLRSGISVFLQTSPGKFDSGRFYPVISHVQWGNGIVLDVDFDSDLDIILPDQRGNQIIQFVNDGKGQFTDKKTLYEIPKPVNIVSLDPVPPNRLELAISTAQSELRLVGFSEPGKWKTIQQYRWMIVQKGLDAADVDNDGTFDLIANPYGSTTIHIVRRTKQNP